MSGAGAEPAAPGTNLRPTEPRTTPPWAMFNINVFGLRVYVGGDLVVWGGIGAFVGWQLQDSAAEAWVSWLALYYAGIILAVVIHELAHALVGWRLGLGVRHVFIGITGGHTMLRIADPTPAKDVAVLVVGPLSNLVIAGGLYLAGVDFATGGFVGVFFWVNLVLGATNLLPLAGMDGAKVVRATVNYFVPDRLEATRQARFWSAFVLVVVAGIPGVWLVVSGHPLAWALVFNAVWFGRGLFTKSESEDAFASLGSLRAEDVMEPGVIVRPGTLLATVIQQHLTREGRKAGWPSIIMSDGQVFGVLSPATLAAARASTVDWRTTIVEDAMEPISRVPVIGPETPAATVLILAGEAESDVVLVVDDDGDLVGCVTIEQLDRAARERMAA